MTNTEAALALTEGDKEEAYELLAELGELPTLDEILAADEITWGV